MKPERSLKQRLLNGETAIGCFVNTPAGGMIEIMGHAGLDFVVLDTEHGPLSIETVRYCCGPPTTWVSRGL